ncbi:unnamed protein product [Closterium sp. NIES-54]
MSRLYTLAPEPPQVAESAQMSASGTVAPPCSCRLLSHQTLLWQHRRLGHPSLPRLRGMHSHLLVSGLPRFLPPLPPSPAPPCLPCVEGRQRAAPHSSFPPRLLPCRLFTWTCGAQPASMDRAASSTFPVRLQLRERFREDLPVLRLPISRGGGFSSDLLRDFYLMEVARTSMIHAAAPHMMWPFAVWYAAHQLNLWLRVSLPETSPTLHWTGEVGDASVFRVWGSRAFVRDTFADKLFARAIPCVFLSFPPDAPGWQFYHPTSRRVFPSEDVTFDESVPFYHHFPYRSAPLPPPPLFLVPSPPPVDPLPPQGPAPSGVSQVDPLPGTVPVDVAVDSGAARGAVSGGTVSRGAASGGAEPKGAEPEGAGSVVAEPGGAEPWGAESEGADLGGAEPRGTASFGGRAGAMPRLSGAAGARGSTAGGTGAGGVGATCLGGAGVLAGAGGTGGAVAAGLGGSRTRGTDAARTGGAGGAGAGGAGAGDPCAGGAGAGDPGGTGAGGTGAGGAGAGDHGARGVEAAGTGLGGTEARGARARGTGAGGAGAVDPGAGGASAGGAVSGGIGARGTVQWCPFFVLLQSSSLPPPDPA